MSESLAKVKLCRWLRAGLRREYYTKMASQNVDAKEPHESQEQANHHHAEVDPAATAEMEGEDEDAKKEQLRVWHVHEAGFQIAFR